MMILLYPITCIRMFPVWRRMRSVPCLPSAVCSHWIDNLEDSTSLPTSWENRNCRQMAFSVFTLLAIWSEIVYSGSRKWISQLLLSVAMVWRLAVYSISEGVWVDSEEFHISETVLREASRFDQEQRASLEDRRICVLYEWIGWFRSYERKDNMKFVQKMLLDIWASYLENLEKSEIS